MKFLKISFILILFCIFVVACAPDTTATPISVSTPDKVVTPGSTQVEPTSTIDLNMTAKKLQGVNVTFLHPWTGKMNDTINQLVDQFNKSNDWGITISVTAPGSASAMKETLLADLQNSTLPDMVAAPVDTLISLNKNSETVVDLSPFTNSKEWGLTSQYLPVFWDQDAKNGYRYGIPAQRNTKVLVYNQTWAQELGFSQPPLTPDEFMAQTCAANAAMKRDNDSQNDGLGGYILDTDALTMASWAAAFGSDLKSFNNPRTIASLTYLRNLMDKGCAWNSKDPAPYAYFASRQTLIYSADLQDLLKQQQAMTNKGNSDAWTVLAFPNSSKAHLLSEGASYAILNTSYEKELAAWLFIRFITSLDAQGQLIRASVTLPLSDEAIQYAVELQDTLPQWVDVVNLLPDAAAVPTTSDWSKAKMIWEDASWQLFRSNLTAESIPDLVKEMDTTLKELTGAQ